MSWTSCDLDFKREFSFVDGHIVFHYVCPMCEGENISEPLDNDEIRGVDIECSCGNFKMYLWLDLNISYRT